MWSYVQEKYDISNNEKDWAMRSINVAFRGYKSRLENDHFYAYTNDEIQMAKRPTSIPEPVFEDLLKYWNSEEAEDTSKACRIRNSLWLQEEGNLIEYIRTHLKKLQTK